MVRPWVHAKAVSLISYPFTCIDRPVTSFESACSLLFTFSILTSILRAIWPSLVSNTMSSAELPLPDINWSWFVLKRTWTVHLILGPRAWVHISVRVSKDSKVCRLTMTPLTLVSCTICPQHPSPTVSKSVNPFANVGTSVFVGISWFWNWFLVWIENLAWVECFFDF